MSESGSFYGTFIDPILKPVRKRVAKEIPPNAVVIDIACGTGAQVFELSTIALKAIGVDFSESMITYARNANLKHKLTNIEFQICDATNLASFKAYQFDLALMSMALHQFLPEWHSSILSEMKRVAKKIIIVDYNVPLPNNYAGIGSRVVEFLAGKEHNQNFKSFYKLGGLDEILKSNQLHIEKSEILAQGALQLVVCSVPNRVSSEYQHHAEDGSSIVDI